MNAAAFHPREILQALARHSVSYVVVGGVAVQAHGGQRLTQDLDLAVPADRENHERLAAALADLDARILGPAGERSATPPIAAREDLIAMKQASGRPQDLSDVELLLNLDDEG